MAGAGTGASPSADPPRVDQNAGGAHAWDAATLRRFLDACRTAEDRLYPLWALLATTGMRRGEALGPRWADVDLDAGRIRVVQTIIQVGGKVSPGDPKTARVRRSVKLDKATVALLRAHRHRMNQERLRVGPDFHDQDLVFHHPDGSWLHPDSTGADRAVLPPELVAMLCEALRGLESGEQLTLVVGSAPADEVLTSQQAADLLNVSRPHVVKLANTGLLPHARVGNRHRFRLGDVLAYADAESARRDKVLAALQPAGYTVVDF